MGTVSAGQAGRVAGRSRPRRRRATGSARARSALGFLGVCLLGAAALFAANWIGQVFRKPTELLAPVSFALAKSPRETWRAYGPLFEEHSTRIMTPDLLAALAQVEGQGNPLARTYWRWKLSLNPFEVYRPASSAVGMLQVTDGAFAEARRFCIHGHEVATGGPWYDLRSCWFNSLYSRAVPAHAIEMTAAHLHHEVVEILSRRARPASLQQKQDLAAVIHLCGAARGEAFVTRGFRAAPGEQCGDHPVRRYLEQVNLMKRRFARLEAD